MSLEIKYSDEVHRLKTMPENYDEKLFNELFQETKKLRKYLALQIDARRFGVDYSEVCSWFDVKFIHAFNKYHERKEVKGFIIKSLQIFKLRTIKNSYLPKNQFFQAQMDIMDLYVQSDVMDDVDPYSDEKDNLIFQVKTYLRTILSEDAYFIFEIDLNPPPFILAELQKQNPEQKKIPKKIPAEIIADFLGINNQNAVDYINGLRKEIQSGINQAIYFFNY